MEVEGKTVKGVDKTANVILTCDSCEDEDQQVEAEGFCTSCQEYMCSDCIKYHRKARLTKHHSFLDRTSMPTKKPESRAIPVCTEKCEKHTAEIIKFFCSDHDTVGCSDCIILDHNHCNKKYITEIAKAFVEGEDINILLKRIGDIRSMATLARTKVGDEANEAANLMEKAVQEIRGFRTEVISYFDTVEQSLLVKCRNIQKNNTNVAEEATQKLDIVGNDMDEIESEVHKRRDRPADLFVTIKRQESRLKKAQDAVDVVSTSVEIKRQRFIESSEWRRLIDKVSAIGDLKDITTVSLPVVTPTDTVHDHHQKPSSSEVFLKSKGKMRPKLIGSISINSNFDKRDPYISSIGLLHSGELICSDWSNCSLKLVDTKAGKITSEITLTKQPWNLAVISDSDQVAVTVPSEQKILIYIFKQKLLFSRSIATEGECRGLDNRGGTLFVSFKKPPKVEILDLQGTVIRTLDNKLYQEDIFDWPLYVCIDDYLLVSDCHRNTIVKLQMDGKVIKTYKYQEFDSPEVVKVLSDNRVLACSNKSGIHLISQDLTKISTLIDVSSPQAFFFDKESDNLYASTLGSDKIFVYKFT